MAGLGAAGRYRVPARAEAPPARAPTPRPFVQRRTRGLSKLGSGGGAEARVAGGQARGRRARPARPARLGLRGARESGLFGRRVRLIVRQVRGRPAAGRAAKVGGGRAGGGERQARARLVVGVSVFFFKTPLGRAGGAFRPPGPTGDVRAAAAADAGLRAARSLQLVSSIVAEPVSHFASPLAAAPLAGRPIAPHPAPRDPRPGRALRTQHPAAARGRAPGRGQGQARKLAGEAASCGSRRFAPGPPQETRGFTDTALARGSLVPCPRGAGEPVGYWKSAGRFSSSPKPLSILVHTLGLGGLSLSLFPLP